MGGKKVMSHDLWLTAYENHCSKCGREDTISLGETNVSYNHCWIWYDKFDTESGFRAMYNIPIADLIPRLEQLRKDLILINGGEPTHDMNDDGSIDWKLDSKLIRTIDGKMVRDDGWARTNFNAMRCIEDILMISTKHVIKYPRAIWYGD